MPVYYPPPVPVGPPASPPAPDLSAAAAGPLSVTMPDGRSAAAHPLPDLIAADRYLASKGVAATRRSPWFAVARGRVLPPGAV